MLALLASACGGETTVRLSVVYEDTWGLSELDVSAAGRNTRVAAAHEVLVWVDEAWAEEAISIEVAGFRDGQRYAFGRVDVTPVRGTEVRAAVALSRLPCGVWCSAGAAACEGDGIVVCEEQDGCMRWGAPNACPSTAPFCSLGVCDASCVDECAEGERRCAGPRGFQECGQSDSDTCLEWLTTNACVEGESCSLGSCASACRDECVDGAVRCQDGGISSCADRDFDGCTEWGPTDACANGESCDAGACRPIGECTDECTADQCNETTLTRCGNFDLDRCLEASTGTSCLPTDGCRIGQCTTSGCESVPRVCDDPPLSYCVDGSTLRVFESAGSCSDGDCDYPFVDQACANCPACDACAGVACDSPPPASCSDPMTLRTYAAAGTCVGGTCSYAPTDTVCSDACQGGECICAPSWTTTTVDDVGNTGFYTSLAVDASGGVHVSYQDYFGRDLRYAYRSPAGTWTATTVDSLGDTGLHTSLAVDPSGGVHVSYQYYPGDLKYAYRSTAGSWTTTTVDTVGDTGLYTSLALDPAGVAHISYYNYSNALLYAERSLGGSWTAGTTVDTVGDTGLYTSLGVDSAGGLHVSYYEWANALHYAYRDPTGTWTTTTVDSEGDTGLYTSLALDASGGVHVSYYDQTNRALRYAYRSPAGSWTTSTVDSDGDTGLYTSIAVDDSNGVHIGYYDQTNRELRYAYRAASGSWTTTTVDSVGYAGLYTSLALDASGGVHISYRDAWSEALRYAYLRGCP